MHSCISLVCLLAFLSTLLSHLLPRKKRVLFSNISDIIALLNPPEASISDLLLARAGPNTRLVHAFGLENTFVSADSVLRKRFITSAREILRQHTRQFAAFPDVARSVVEESARRLRSSRKPSMSFASFVGAVTLRIVVGSMLGGHIPEDSDEDTVFVVEAINELWLLSKNAARPPPAAGLLDTVNAHLHRWMPGKYERPLDFVIPAHETMWRVIAATVARAIHDSGARAAFSAYLDSPTQDQFVRFKKNSSPQQPSVEAFLCEVLRLHPPSRSISRTAPSRLGVFQYLWAAPTTTHVANIEALHQDKETWGSDAAVFDPMRFHESRLSYGQKYGYIPFSYGPLRCIAFKEAPRFAAIVAAAVLEIVSGPDAKYRLVCGEKIGRREGWEGWLIEARD